MSKFFADSRKSGFTLAEVLITLGIIAVVAAMTLPTLLNNSQNRQLEAGLKKNYSVIQQALDMYQADNGYRLKSHDNIGNDMLKKAIMPYLSVLKDCGYGLEPSACVQSDQSGASVHPNPYRNYSNSRVVDNSKFDDGQLILTDGSMLFFENVGADLLLIHVDVNGYGKNPNRWGFDLFTFQIMDDGKLLPGGANGTHFFDQPKYCDPKSLEANNGIICTYKALTDKDYFKNLPK